MEKEQTTCQRCGECCRKGGPALHSEDLTLVKNNKLPINMLVTLRRGELAYNPMSNSLKPTVVELVKIKGAAGKWNCYYYQDDVGCTIYTTRPLSCRVLKCWETQPLLDLVEKDTLTRFDILEKDDPIYTIIEEHERHCPLPDFEALVEEISDTTCKRKKDLEQLVNLDLQIRSKSVKEFGLSLDQELFYFGRPLFQLLQQLGITAVEKGDRLELRSPSFKI